MQKKKIYQIENKDKRKARKYRNIIKNLRHTQNTVKQK